MIYHRLESRTQTSADARKQVESKMIYGNDPRVKAYSGPLGNRRGIEFTTDVPADLGHVPGKPIWSEPTPGVVRIDADTVAIRVSSITNHQEE